MIIKISPIDRVLIVEHNKESLTFPYGTLWANLKKASTYDVFGVTNSYLEVVDPRVVDHIWSCIKEAHLLLSEASGINDLDGPLKDVITSMMQSFRWSHLHQWAQQHSGIHYSTVAPIEYRGDPKNKATTYLRHECYELHVFSILVKLLAPILGSYVRLLHKEVGVNHKERLGIAIISDCTLVEMPPYLRQMEYMEALAQRREGGMQTPLENGLAKELLPDQFMALAMVRRLVVSKPRDREAGEIIAIIYQFLEDKSTSFTQTRFRDKVNASSSDDKESGEADNWRLPQVKLEEFTATSGVYIEDIPRMCRDVGYPQLTEASQQIYKQLMESDYVIHDGTLPIEALLMYKAIHTDTPRDVDRSPRLASIAITAAILKARGFDTLYSFVLSVQVASDPNVMTMTASSGGIMCRLTKDNITRLNARYNLNTQAKRINNPFMVMADAVVSVIGSHVWKSPEPGIGENIRNDLAELFCTTTCN